MKIEYKTTYGGYLTILRSIQKLLGSKTLNFSSLGAYICFVMQADWDKRHPLTYGAITRSDKELSIAFGCDPSTINRQRKGLVRSGLLEISNNITYIKNLEIFEIGNIKAVLQKKCVNTHEFFLKSQSFVAKKLFTSE